MKYCEWKETVSLKIREDSLWKMKVYRYALFLSDICWADISKLAKDIRTKSLSDQLYRAVGSVAANLEEGYSRKSGKDRARFYEYALGSARESRGWYYRSRHLLGDSVVDHRIGFLTEIIKMLLAIVPEERTQSVCEDSVEYKVENCLDCDIPF